MSLVFEIGEWIGTAAFAVSGAMVAVLIFATKGIGEDCPPAALVAVALVSIGVISLGITEAREDEELRAALAMLRTKLRRG